MKISCFILFVTGLFLLSSCASSGRLQRTDYISVKLDGYKVDCCTEAVVSIKEHGTWRVVNQTLPGKGLYYLDDQFGGYGWWDVLSCIKIDSLLVRLVEYKEIGMKEAPPNSGLSPKGIKIPVFKTIYLKGDIKIEITYYSNSTCTDNKVFTEFITR
jgi:hypothetical protein